HAIRGVRPLHGDSDDADDTAARSEHRSTLAGEHLELADEVLRADDLDVPGLGERGSKAAGAHELLGQAPARSDGTWTLAGRTECRLVTDYIEQDPAGIGERRDVAFGTRREGQGA